MEPLTREGSPYTGVEDSEPAQEQEFALTQTVDSAISALKADFDTATVKARTDIDVPSETELESKGLPYTELTYLCAACHRSAS